MVLLPDESNLSLVFMYLYKGKWSFLSNDFGFPQNDCIRVA